MTRKLLLFFKSVSVAVKYTACSGAV